MSIYNINLMISPFVVQKTGASTAGGQSKEKFGGFLARRESSDDSDD